VKSRAQKPTLATLAKKQAAKKGKKTPPPPPVPAPSVKPNIVTLEKVEALANANRENPWMRIVLAYAVRAELGARHRAVAESLADVLDRVFPAQRETGDALWALASYCEDAGAIDSALLWYKHLVDDCPKHYRADAAQFQIGRRLYQADKKEEAIEAFVALGKNYPTSTLRSQGYYLCGTMASAQGDAKRARMYFVCASFEGVGDFFAHRALERMQGDNPATGPGATNLKIDGAHPVLIPIPNKRAALEPLPEAIENDPRLARIRFFGLNGIEAGEWEALETMHAVQDRPDAGIWYAAIAEAGYAHTATQWIESIGWGYDANHRPEGGHLRVWFPRAYWSDVCAAAKAAGVDPYLVLSVMRQESTYRPSIVSSSGAVGLMQLMPGTAQWLTHVEPAIPAEAAGNLRVPPYSVQLGAHYLGRMINQSGGNLIYALAAYNAGPGNCDKWRKSFGNLGPDAFIDNIPFAETKNYVRRVLANYAAYHSLYAPVK
jgi:soluble lytic murein transglycosylase